MEHFDQFTYTYVRQVAGIEPRYLAASSLQHVAGSEHRAKPLHSLLHLLSQLGDGNTTFCITSRVETANRLFANSLHANAGTMNIVAGEKIAIATIRSCVRLCNTSRTLIWLQFFFAIETDPVSVMRMTTNSSRLNGEVHESQNVL